MCYFRNLRRVVGRRWPPAALTWSSTLVPCPHRQTSSSNSSRCPRKWFQQHCSSPCPASFCERAKPRKSSPLHHLKPADYTHPEGMLSLQITLLFLSLHFFYLCLCDREWQYLTFPAFLSLDLSPSHPFLSSSPSMISSCLHMHPSEVLSFAVWNVLATVGIWGLLHTCTC